jgi:hypothetical protein
MNLRNITITALMFCFYIAATAQTNLQDVLYLKNGSIIRGTIVQFIPDSIVKIQTADRSIFVFPSLEISKIQKEENPLAAQKVPDSSSQIKENNILASLFAALSIPGGEFSDGAETGFALGFQLHSKKDLGILANFSFSSNPSPGDESWSTYMILLGLKASIQKKNNYDLYFAPVLGLFIQKIESISGYGLAYGGIFGYQINDRIGFGIRFVASNPEYEIGGYKFNISSSLIHFYCGVSF